MHLTIKAVLARFNGNVWEAIKYCDGIAREYPHLKAEYEGIIVELTMKTSAASAGGAL